MSDVGGPPGVPLGYETPGRQGISGVRQAAWICLLVLGILTILVGLCLGGMMGCVSLVFHAISTAAAPAGGGGGAPGMPAIPSYVPWLMWGMAAVLLVGPIGFGVGEIVCSVKLRNGSGAAGVVAAVLVGLQLMIVVLGIGASVVGAAMSGRGDWGNMIFSGLFYVAIGAGLGVVEWLLIKVVREPRNAWVGR